MVDSGTSLTHVQVDLQILGETLAEAQLLVTRQIASLINRFIIS